MSNFIEWLGAHFLYAVLIFLAPCALVIYLLKGEVSISSAFVAAFVAAFIFSGDN